MRSAEPPAVRARPPVMRRLRSLAAVGLVTGAILVGTPITVLACSCAILPPDEQAASADAVFVGRVDSIEEIPDAALDQGFSNVAVFGFAVEGSFKGDVFERTAVMAGGDAAGCGISFGSGERWLIFANWDGAMLTTNLCSGNAPLAADEEPPLPLTAPRDAEPAVADGGWSVPLPVVGIVALVVVIGAVSAWAFTRRPSGSRA